MELVSVCVCVIWFRFLASAWVVVWKDNKKEFRVCVHNT